MILAALAISAAGCSDQQEPKVVHDEDHPEYIGVKDGTMMRRAVVQARKTYQQFVDALANRCEGCWGYEIKVPYPTPSGEDEHIRVSNLSWDGAQFHGTIANEPIDTTAVKFGQHVHVLPTEISDWKYVDGDQLVGGYTVRVIYALSSPDERKMLDARNSFKVPPVDF